MTWLTERNTQASLHRRGSGTESVSILLVEDSEDDALLIQECLHDAGIRSFRYLHSVSLASALVKLEVHRVDAILLDLGLPDSQGLGTLDKIRDAYPSIPIVVLTGTDDMELGVHAIQHGANDFLTKARAATDGEMLSRSITYSIERKRLEERDVQLAAARDIQRLLFPRCAPEIEGFDIAGICHPAEMAGGDYFDFLPQADGSLGVFLADVSGHGVGPALVMAELRAYIRGLLQFGHPIEDVLCAANRLLAVDTSSDIFVTLFFVEVDPQRRCCRWIGAGHNAHLIRADGSTCELASTTLPLAIKEEVRFRRSPELQLNPGDSILMCTDGIVETQRLGGSQFGTQRTIELVRNIRSQPAIEIAQSLFSATQKFGSPQGQVDDVTVVVIKAC